MSAMYRILNSICISAQHWGVAILMLKAIVDEFDHLSLMPTSFEEQTIQPSVMATPIEIN